jgi:hypothetical protein
MEPEQGIGRRPRRLGDHLADAVVVEAIDHRAIEPGNRPHLPHGIAEHGRHQRLRLQPDHHRSHQRRRVGGLVGAARLPFDDQDVAGIVQREVEQAAVGRQPDAVQALRATLARQARQPVAHVVQRRLRDQPVHLHADRVRRLGSQELLEVGRRPDDRPIVRQPDQEAEALDMIEERDRLARALVEIG